ncbi:DUF6392 family protein [Pseudomonas citronellolis]|uniref:DUF6392 family protein n=1 Tax=Pseudomonas citronellolis TaxID=53408 RepID=UPI0022BA23A6|nr:DUF6392 family protein [Pseudomonas citronellolis]
MHTKTIETLTRALGHTYTELTTKGEIPKLPLQPLLKGSDNEDLIMSPAIGVEMWFDTEELKLQQIIISLLPTDEGISIYTGTLPEPFSQITDQAKARSVLGEPHQSLSERVIPGSGGKIFGGWDGYYLDQSKQRRVGFRYTKEKAVCAIGFKLTGKSFI